MLNLITILGHTAGGKTSLAANVANLINGEIISADSRQVYKGMDLGTGKDYNDYIVGGSVIPYHLIDIADAGYEYNVFEFRKDFSDAFRTIQERGKLPVMCGGTGLYIESILRNYRMVDVPTDDELRENLNMKTLEELVEILKSYRDVHNTTDTESKKRAIRAIEIEKHQQENVVIDNEVPEINALVVGVAYEREERRNRITMRLHQRIEAGMIEEVRSLMEKGIDSRKMEYYGLEYKFVSRYIDGKLTFDQMVSQLNTAIHRFAKRQMTYFRGMERRGIAIQWLEGAMSLEEKTDRIMELYSST